MESMKMFMMEAGWGIYPVLLFGGAALILALTYAARPRRSRYALVVGFSTATVLAGFLGALTGVQNTVLYVSKVVESERWLFLVGLRESLNNMVAAFVIVTFSCLLVTVGSFRGQRREEREEPAQPVSKTMSHSMSK